MKTRSVIALAACALALAACSKSGFSGTYGTQEKSDIQFVFDGDDVTVVKNGESVTGKYKVEDSKLSVIAPGGQTWNFKINDKGCIYDGGIMILMPACKQ